MVMTTWMKRIIGFKEMDFKDGYFMVMGIPSYLYSLNVLAVMHKVAKDNFGKKGLALYYEQLKVQSHMATRLLRNRFGFPIEKGVPMQLEHGEMLGAGIATLVRADYQNHEYIVRLDSTFAKEYLSTFGMQKEPVDVMVMGAFTGMLREWTGNNDLVCIETQCIAAGKPYCEFVIKAKSKFDLKDPAVKAHLYDDEVAVKLDDVVREKLGFPIRKMK